MVVTDPPTNKQTGPITIHCAAASMQCNKPLRRPLAPLYIGYASSPPPTVRDNPRDLSYRFTDRLYTGLCVMFTDVLSKVGFRLDLPHARRTCMQHRCIHARSNITRIRWFRFAFLRCDWKDSSSKWSVMRC